MKVKAEYIKELHKIARKERYLHHSRLPVYFGHGTMELRLDTCIVRWDTEPHKSDSPFIVPFGELFDTELVAPPDGSFVNFKNSKAKAKRRIVEWASSRDSAPNAMTKIIAVEKTDDIPPLLPQNWGYNTVLLETLHQHSKFVNKKSHIEYGLTGICIDSDGTAVATDAYWLIYRDNVMLEGMAKKLQRPITVGEEKITQPFIFPPLKFLPSKGRCCVAVRGDTLVIQCGDYKVYVSSMEETYPDWRKVIPAKTDKRKVSFTLDTETANAIIDIIPKLPKSRWIPVDMHFGEVRFAEKRGKLVLESVSDEEPNVRCLTDVAVQVSADKKKPLTELDVVLRGDYVISLLKMGFYTMSWTGLQGEKGQEYSPPVEFHQPAMADKVILMTRPKMKGEKRNVKKEVKLTVQPEKGKKKAERKTSR